MTDCVLRGDPGKNMSFFIMGEVALYCKPEENKTLEFKGNFRCAPSGRDWALLLDREIQDLLPSTGSR